MEKHPPGIYSLFLPCPSLPETYCAWFFTALQSPVRQDDAWDMGAGLGGCGELPSPLQGPALPCAAPAWAPGDVLLLWHREREGLANRIRSCGTSQHSQALA